MDIFNTTTVGIVVIFIAVVAVLGFIASRIKKAGMNEALIVVGQSGGKGQEPKPIKIPLFNEDGSEKLDADGKQAFDEVYNDSRNQKVVIGDRVVVWPVINQVQRISLEQYQHEFPVQAPDVNFINTAVRVAIQFHVAGDPDSVRRAAQLFQTTQDGLSEIIASAIEGHVRAIIGELDFKTIASDRKRFKALVIKSIAADFAEQGIAIDTLNIKDVSTPGSNYLDNLGAAESASAAKNAATAQAEAHRASEVARIDAEQAVATRNKELALNQAAIKAETDKAAAGAAAAGPLAQAEQDKLIAEKQRLALVEQANVTQEKLDIEIRKPAEAAAYAQVKQAEGARDSANAEAEADAYRRTTVAEANKKATVLDAEGEQQRVELSARAEATAIKVKGEAQAGATTAVGTADAVAIEKKADALSKYGQAALQQEAINKMPQVASAIAAALGGIGTLTVISKDGPSAIANSVADIASDVPTLLKNLTGVDLSALLSGIAGGSPAAGAVASLEARQPPA